MVSYLKSSRVLVPLCLILLAFVSPEVSARKTTTSISFAPKPHHQIKNEEMEVPAFKQQSELLMSSKSTMALSQSLRGGAMFTQKNLQGVLSLIIFDVLLRKYFVSNNITFPSMLAGCLGLFTILIFMEGFKKGLGEALFQYLNPGAALLAKWLPIFFVPGLAMLPLAPSIGSPFEVLKVIAVVVVGWYFSLFSTGFAVLKIRTLQGNANIGASPTPTTKGKADSTSPAPKVFPDEVYHPVLKGAVLFGILATVLTNMSHAYATPVQTLFMACVTIGSYIYGTRMDKSITAIVHPLVTSTIVTLLVTNLSGKLTGRSFEDVLRTYKAGSLSFMKGGAGDFLLFLLGPSVISMCTAMYSRRTIMKDNLLVVIVSMLISAVGGLTFTAAFVRLLQIASPVLRISVLPRNVTTALAMAISAMMDGDLGITASVVVMTGIVGATFGIRVLNSVGIMDSVSRGLAIGSSSQGLGVASMINEVDAFPFAAIGMVLTAVCATTLVSITPVREGLLKLALGQ